MDLAAGKQQLLKGFKKYQYIALVVLIGVVLMLLPQKTEPAPETVSLPVPQEADLETRLAAILGQIQGVGSASVLLTESAGRDTIYQQDTGQNQANRDTVIVRNGSREETGLVRQILPPRYQGAVIVCEGGDSAAVRLCVVESVKSLTGLSSDFNTLMKMK